MPTASPRRFPAIPPKRIVDAADISRFLDYFVERLLGPVNPVYGSE